MSGRLNLSVGVGFHYHGCYRPVDRPQPSLVIFLGLYRRIRVVLLKAQLVTVKD